MLVAGPDSRVWADHHKLMTCWGGVTKCVNRLGSSMIELVLPIIKYDIAPLEVGPEFALN